MSHVGPPGHIIPQPDGHNASRQEPTPGVRHILRTERVLVVDSRIRDLGSVTFPFFHEEKIYMEPFRKEKGRVILRFGIRRWLDTVTAMLDGIKTDETMYLMVDCAELKAGAQHRRAGPHIDGHWVEDKKTKPRYPEALLLASDVSACVAYVGEYEPHFGKGGDCSKIDLSDLKRVRLKANHAYIGNVYMIHESLPIKEDCQRTLVRINIPKYK